MDNWPKKLNKDYIKESIVELRYESEIPFEALIGIVYNEIDTDFVYSSRPLIKESNQGLSISKDQQVNIQFGLRPVFYNQKIKVELQPNCIIFNCFNEYIGWDSYFEEIQKVLNSITKNYNFITRWTRVGVRYINEITDLKLSDCIKLTYSFNSSKFDSDTYIFKTEFKKDNSRIILNLTNNLEIKKSESIINFSLIDIDVICQIFENISLNELFSIIDKTHNEEKDSFFELLKEEFISKLTSN